MGASDSVNRATPQENRPFAIDCGFFATEPRRVRLDLLAKDQ
jgi:hypothetical protein